MDDNIIRPEWIPSGYNEDAKKVGKTNLNICKDILFGVAIGDAVGVPVEFKSRKEINLKQVIDMTGYGTTSRPGLFQMIVRSLSAWLNQLLQVLH